MTRKKSQSRFARGRPLTVHLACLVRKRLSLHEVVEIFVVLQFPSKGVIMSLMQELPAWPTFLAFLPEGSPGLQSCKNPKAECFSEAYSADIAAFYKEAASAGGGSVWFFRAFFAKPSSFHKNEGHLYIHTRLLYKTCIRTYIHAYNIHIIYIYTHIRTLAAVKKSTTA